MTPEDAAKLLDMKGAEKTDNSDGSYTLSRTEKVTDEKTGKTITRTTYVTVTGSNVTTRTTTTLTVTREKEEHTSEKDGFGKDGVPVSGEFTLPQITVTDQNDPENKRTISPDMLGRLIAESRSQGSDTAAPETPVTPDVPAAPDAPSLPPVQDSAAPGITILPASRTVQAAHALPQTGVNWLAAIGLAVSGFALTAAGAFVSLTGRHARH